MVFPAVVTTVCYYTCCSVRKKAAAFFDLYLDQLAVIFPKLYLGFATF